MDGDVEALDEYSWMTMGQRGRKSTWRLSKDAWTDLLNTVVLVWGLKAEGAKVKGQLRDHRNAMFQAREDGGLAWERSNGDAEKGIVPISVIGGRIRV